MNLNEKSIAELAAQLGLKGNAGISGADLKRLQGKSDGELEREILRVREQLTARGMSNEKQVALLRNLLPMTDSKQKARLLKVIELMEG